MVLSYSLFLIERWRTGSSSDNRESKIEISTEQKIHEWVDKYGRGYILTTFSYGNLITYPLIVWLSDHDSSSVSSRHSVSLSSHQLWRARQLLASILRRRSPISAVSTVTLSQRQSRLIAWRSRRQHLPSHRVAQPHSRSLQRRHIVGVRWITQSLQYQTLVLLSQNHQNLLWALVPSLEVVQI